MYWWLRISSLCQLNYYIDYVDVVQTRLSTQLFWDMTTNILLCISDAVNFISADVSSDIIFDHYVQIIANLITWMWQIMTKIYFLW